MTGTVVQVSFSRGGIPKHAVPSAHATETGLAGDSWRYPFHGGRRKAMLLVTAEGIDELAAMGFGVYPGALGENITTRGLDRRALRVGQRCRVGEAEIELVSIRMPCSTLDVYGSGIQAALYDDPVAGGDAESRRWGLSGFYVSVIRPGLVSCGDAISVCTRRSS